MKHGLTAIILLVTLSRISAQSTDPAADSLVYGNAQVLAFKDGSLYRSYPVYFRYPSMARENKLEGQMSFTCYLNEKCEVAKVEYQNSLGKIFEESIEESLPYISKVFKAYDYQNCEQVVFYQELDFKL